ncbi:MAG: Hydroxyacylglutathione hydrolase [Candidatus Rifleibacterium amylolyticum]|nr:MAG: Hydroxyacylglutathione hydrolase [Candidatus Rifleibacterium amylolyticum]NLF97233.1 MBL fold metallo-hydrolase [Candidatus Riflebacteria bacterium]
MIFEQLSLGNMQNFCYLFADETGREGFIIDPAFDHNKILATIKKHKVNLTRIILTHHHFDHINAASQVKAQTGAEIICHRDTAPLLHGATTPDRLIDEGYSFTLGDRKVICLHTPGHAPGSICLLVADKWLVTGDTLFINDCGRADLPGSDPKQLFASLQRLKSLPDHLIVCTGHNYGPLPTRTLGEEKRLNPALNAKSFEEFCSLP